MCQLFNIKSIGHETKNTINSVLPKKVKNKQKGLCPIYCRITYLGKRKEFATGEFIIPEAWTSKKQKAASESLKNEHTNLQLEIISSNLKKEFLQLQVQNKDFTVQDIFNAYFKVSENKRKLMSLHISEYLEKQRKLIGIDLQEATWKKFNYACQSSQRFH